MKPRGRTIVNTENKFVTSRQPSGPLNDTLRNLKGVLDNTNTTYKTVTETIEKLKNDPTKKEVVADLNDYKKNLEDNMVGLHDRINVGNGMNLLGNIDQSTLILFMIGAGIVAYST